METDKSRPERKYEFRYINSLQHNFNIWVSAQRSWEDFGTVELFYGILCPLITASVEVTERIRAEYDTIEMLVLKLYSLGIKDAAHISQYTGLKPDMTENILKLLENGYKHIENGAVTKEGKKSLKEELNIHSFKTTKQIQFEALTYSLLTPDMFQTTNADEAYFDERDKTKIKRYEPRDKYIDKSIYRDIIENFNSDRYYQGERNVEEAHDIVSQTCTYVEAFVVKYSFLPHPFIVFPYKTHRNLKFLPVSMSESNAKILEKHKISFGNYNPPVFDDANYKTLCGIVEDMHFDVERKNLSKEFALGSVKYKMVKKGTASAELKLHPDCRALPCYCLPES